MKSTNTISPDRANPLLSFVIDENEYKELNSIADYHGVSIAQVARGYFRLGRKRDSSGDRVKIVRLGISPSSLRE